MASQDAATNIGFHQRDHDILSLLSIFIHAHRTLTTGLLLAGVLIDQNFLLPPPINQGAYFEVYSVPSTRLTQTCLSPDLLNAIGDALPQVVAVKCPKVNGELRDKRNQKLWSSMAMELQILRHPDIQDHENIVTILGVCWQSVRGQVMPAFVMELAHTDLQAMMESNPDISTRQLLGLAIDVCAGVSALHEVGIIHGDIKPANILVFKDPEVVFIAKISDFGSSLLKTDIRKPINLPFSSGIWLAPECRGALNGDQLIAADTFSLALMVAQILSRGYMMQTYESKDDIEVTYLNAAGAAYHMLIAVTQSILKAEENERYGAIDAGSSNEGTHSQGENGIAEDDSDDNSHTKSIAQIARAIGKAVSPHLFEPSIRPSSHVLHRNLRVCLSWILHRDMVDSLNRSDPARILELIEATKMNSREQEILQNPALEAPTEEDTDRVWNFAKMSEYLDRSFYAISQQENLPELTEISRTDCEHKIARILKNWKKGELTAPEDMYALRDAGAVVEADRSLGTLRILPNSCLKQIMGEMMAVARDERESKLRRAEAAWQCSMLQFRLKKLEKGREQDLDSILQGMLLAARLGHTAAGGVIGWLHAVFDRPLSVSMEEEKQWLYAAICMGSCTARRRLVSLDVVEYQRAVSHLRSRYLGIGISVPQNYYDSNVFDDDDLFLLLDYSPSSLGDVFQLAATSGRYNLVRRMIVSKAHELDINRLHPANETALLKACRSGHASIALLLLDNGGDPTLANDEGATPLHFLSSFDDEYIPEMTDALIRASADREARSRQGWRYRQCIDSTYGDVEGTPLTWAVAAGNETATQALMDVGADPFDVLGRDIQYEDGWSNNVHVFPVWQAAITCQYRLLEILLEPFKDHTEDLNGIYRKFGTRGLKDRATLLGWVVTDGNSSTCTRILIHGKDYEKAFQETFEILVRHGAEPLHINGESDSIIGTAVNNIQPYVLDFLLRWQSGKLCADPAQWLACILTACSHQDKAAFELLVGNPQADKVSSEQWNSFFATTHALPDAMEFLNRLKDYRPSNADFHTHFERAIYAGKYVLARWIYETGECNLTKITDGKTILGELIISSKVYSSSSRHIDALLDMEIPDAVYYDVFDFKGSKLSALHAAVFLMEYQPGSFRSLSPLRSIVQRKYGPDYLNLAISEGVYRGYTAMHIAVRTCNEGAVRYLLDEERDSLDLTLLDYRGSSLIDLASYLLSNQASNMELWEVPREKRKEADQRHFENTLMILHMLYDTKQARPRKILATVTRIEVDELFVVLYEQEQFRIMKVKPSVFDGLSPEQLTRLGALYSMQACWDLTMIWHQIVEQGPRLQLNDTLFLFKSDAMSPDDFEYVSSTGTPIRRLHYSIGSQGLVRYQDSTWRK